MEYRHSGRRPAELVRLTVLLHVQSTCTTTERRRRWLFLAAISFPLIPHTNDMQPAHSAGCHFKHMFPRLHRTGIYITNSIFQVNSMTSPHLHAPAASTDGCVAGFSMARDDELCPVCGQRAYFEVTEVLYHLREFTVGGCCSANVDGWLDTWMEADRKMRARWFREQTGLSVRELLRDYTIDYGLTLHPVDWHQARDFIAFNHRHTDPPLGWKFGISVYNGPSMMGVATVGRPVSRVLQERGYLEITRVCVLPRDDFSRHACSMLYGWCARESFRRGFDRVATYTLDRESGTSLRAAGFTLTARSSGGSWDTPSRRRRRGKNFGPKLRWERHNKGAPAAIARQLTFDAVLG